MMNEREAVRQFLEQQIPESAKPKLEQVSGVPVAEGATYYDHLKSKVLQMAKAGDKQAAKLVNITGFPGVIAVNERQRRFCEAYAACGNAAQAAREAGYSDKTARSQGQRLLTDVDILKYVRELQNESATARIASIKQIKAFWSDVMHDPTEKTADRLRAGELLAQSAGAFIHRLADDGETVSANGEFDGEDVIIYLPAIDGEKGANND